MRCFDGDPLGGQIMQAGLLVYDACDTGSLFGLLQSATKGHPCAHIIQNKEEQDGLLAWIGLTEDNKHSGSESLKSEELEDLVLLPCDHRAWKTVATVLLLIKNHSK